jgi:hypothetical protein
MISAAALIAIALTIVGGAGMSAALSAPILALVGVHSLGAAGGIIGGLSTIQKIYAANLLLKGVSEAAKVGKQLHPVHAAILAKLQKDIAAAHTKNFGTGRNLLRVGTIEARHINGPLGWGRTPIVFVYTPPE